MTNFAQLASELVEHEGFRASPYSNDGAGVPTIGIGFALIIYNKNIGKWLVRNDLDMQLQAAGLPPATANDHLILQSFADTKNKIRNTPLNLNDLSFRFSKEHAEKSAIHILQENEIVLAQKIGNQWHQYPDTIKHELHKIFYVRGYTMLANNVDVALQAGDLQKAADLIEEHAPPLIRYRVKTSVNILRHGTVDAPGKYSVRPGDTFSGIADYLGVSTEELRAANSQITNPNRLSIGQELYAPASPAATDAGDEHGSIAGGNLFARAEGFLSGLGSSAARLFARGESNAAYSSLITNRNITRTSNLNIESLLGAEISRSADSIVERILRRNPGMFHASAGRLLSQSAERFGKALAEGRIRDMEDAFTSVLKGKKGEIGIAADIGNQVVGGLLQAGLGKLFGGGKTSTVSYESARSLQAGNHFRMSRGQQAAEMLTQLQKGQRNL